MPDKAEKFEDVLIRYSTLRMRAERSLSREVLNELNSLGDEIKALLAKTGLPEGALKAIRLRQILTEIDKLIQEAQTSIKARFEEGLKDLAQTDSEILSESLGKATDQEIEGLNPAVLIAGIAVGLGRYLAINFNRLKVDLVKRFAIETPESMDDALDNIDEAFDKSGIDFVKLADSTQAGILNDTLKALYKDHPDITGMRWNSTLDSKTCLLCASLSGTPLDLDDPRKPPDFTHPSCRCFLSPIFKGDEQPFFTSPRPYEEWLESQPESIQKEILGPTRFKIFFAERQLPEAKQGGLPLEMAIDRKRIIPVKELKAQWANLLALQVKEESLQVRKVVKEVLGIPSSERGKLF